MNRYYQALRVFAAVLLCALLQYCTRDIPMPAPAVKNTTQTSSLTNKSAGSAAGEALVAQQETIRVAAPKDSKRSANSTTVPSNTPSLLALCYDYYVVYYTNGVETGRDFLYTNCSGGGGSGGGGGGDGGSSGGGGGGGSGTGTTGAISPTTVLVVPPTTPVNNIQEYLKCFTASQAATFTAYAQQPRPNHPDTWAPSASGPNVGHTFISITQNGITRVLGFYPTSDKAIFDDGPGVIGDNSQHAYSVRITTTISPGSLNSLLTYIYSHSNDTYSLTDYNCTNFGIGAAGAAGLTLPNTYGDWGIGGGSTPGTLGQDMRTMPLPVGATRSLSGTSPANTGGC